ncbi:transposase [Sneathiella sp. HT1-7]|nr:transposase [Sneathiella sp. HT1-7]
MNGEARYLWRAVDQEDEVLEVFASKIWSGIVEAISVVLRHTEISSH